jgi:hypothetical protein
MNECLLTLVVFFKANDIAAQEGLWSSKLAFLHYFMSKFTVACQVVYESTHVHARTHTDTHTPTICVSTVFV